jgi:hypothetical protein
MPCRTARSHTFLPRDFDCQIRCFNLPGHAASCAKSSRRIAAAGGCLEGVATRLWTPGAVSIGRESAILRHRAARVAFSSIKLLVADQRVHYRNPRSHEVQVVHCTIVWGSIGTGVAIVGLGLLTNKVTVQSAEISAARSPDGAADAVLLDVPRDAHGVHSARVCLRRSATPALPPVSHRPVAVRRQRPLRGGQNRSSAFWRVPRLPL